MLVLFDGELLGSCQLTPRPLTSPEGPWRHVLVEYRPRVDAPRSGLHVAIDRLECLQPTYLPHWSPTVEWTAGFGARGGAASGRHLVRSVHLRFGSRVQTTAAALLLSANLQQWTPTVQPYAYHGEPRISHIEPSTGPSAGGAVLTLHGTGLHGHALCGFAALPTGSADGTPAESAPSYVVPASYVALDGSVLCEAPSLAALPPELAGVSPLHVRLSADGQQYSSDAPRFWLFDGDAHVTHRLSPASGPTDGGTSIRLSLAGINASTAWPIRKADRAACLFFTAHMAAAATLAEDGTQLRCVSPRAAEEGDALIEVTLNGQQVLRAAEEPFDTSLASGGTSPALFHFYTQPQLEGLAPLSGPSTRGASVLVHISPAVPLAAASAVTCSFGDTKTLGALLPPDNHLHLAAAGMVYAPRRLATVEMHDKWPDREAALGGVSAGAQLAGRFLAAGLTPRQVAQVQYDADPIDGDVTNPLLRYTSDGHKYDLATTMRPLVHQPSVGRERWLAASKVLQWYYDGRGTCVGYGPPNDYCNASQVVCNGVDTHGSESTFGNYDSQAAAATVAILAAGNVHPDCPSLQRFGPDAAAWLHSGATRWLDSTLLARSALAAGHSPLTARLSPLTTHHSPLTSHHSPLTTHR